MSVYEKLRIVLAGVLIFIALFYNKANNPITPDNPPKPPKVAKPTDEFVKLVSPLLDSKVSSLDAGKLSGAFSALGEFIKTDKVKTAIELELLLSNVGKKTFGKELDDKYVGLSSSISSLIDKVVGGQSDNKKFSDEEKSKLSELFYAISWVFYSTESDNEYDVYLAKTKQSISDYYNINPSPIPNPNTKCPLGLCDGSGKIVQGDGHVTECPHLKSKEIQ